MHAAARLALLLAAALALACGAAERPAAAPEPSAADDDGLDAAQRARIEQLLALGYVQGSEPPSPQRGVTVYDRDAAQPGLNLAVSAHAPEARLMDLEGRELHRWSRPYAELFPGRSPLAGTDFHKYWRRAHLLPDGSLLAIVESSGLVKLDPDSQVSWILRADAHHDLDVAPDGTISLLTRAPRTLRDAAGQRRIMEDFVSIVSPAGRERRRISLYDAVANSFYAAWLKDARPYGDIFHTNTLEILDSRLAHLSDDLRAGTALVSIHGLHAIAVVDLAAKRVVWGLRGDWRLQHQPTALESGRILLFDNLGKSGHSRVLEIDPLSGEILWSYEDPEPQRFYSLCCGSIQRLANGNTLVTDSEQGRAFEIDAAGTLVWEWWSPYRVEGADGEEKVATLFEVVRLPEDLPLDWLPGER